MARKRHRVSSTADGLVEHALNDRLERLEMLTDADGIAIIGSMLNLMDDVVKTAIESRSKKLRKRLLVILETEGGSIELVQRIVETMRHHYQEVLFIVPNKAMSAGTVLALSGDEIMMNYYSRLGPIDPQIYRNGRLLPAVGYIELYDDCIAKSAKNELTPAEATILLNNIDAAELFQIKEHIKLSKTLLKEWLVKYKFKNWKVTERRKTPVSKSMKVARAEKVASTLSDPKLWHSHGRGISMDVLTKNVGLRIKDFDKIPNLSNTLKEYYEPVEHYLQRLGQSGTVHVPGLFMPIPW